MVLLLRLVLRREKPVIEAKLERKRKTILSQIGSDGPAAPDAWALCRDNHATADRNVRDVRW